MAADGKIKVDLEQLEGEMAAAGKIKLEIHQPDSDMAVAEKVRLRFSVSQSEKTCVTEDLPLEIVMLHIASHASVQNKDKKC